MNDKKVENEKEITKGGTLKYTDIADHNKVDDLWVAI